MERLDEFITLRQAAQISGYNSDYLSYLIRTGKLRGKKIGKSWLTTREDIDRCFKKRSSLKAIVRSIYKRFLISSKVAIVLLIAALFISVLSYGFSALLYEQGYAEAHAKGQPLHVSSTLDQEPLKE